MITLKNFFQLFRFGVVGVAAAIVNYLVVILLVELLHWLPLIANIIGFSLGFQVSYFGHRFWTFSHKQHTIQSLPKFIFVAILGFSCNESVFALMLHFTALPYTISLIVAILAAATVTFSCSKFWVFK
ncbi:MAG: GtrA family protein [Gammaproteobacteria bacterium]|nr:GtrA family protein [Gammaproteobacteria bacterium]